MQKNRRYLWLLAVVAVFFIIIYFLGYLPFGSPISLPDIFKNDTSEKLTISFDHQGLVPFDIMIIDGENLDPTAATSVIFTTFSKQTLIIPALSVNSTSVEVPVPPLAYNKDSGHFGIDGIRIKVVQVKKVGDKLAVKTSNEVAGISVLMPKAPSAVTKAFPNKMSKGTVTRAFVTLALKRLDFLAGQLKKEDEQIKTAYAETQEGMEKLAAGLDRYIKDPNTKIELATNGTTTASIGNAEIAWLDAFYSAFLGFAEERQLLVIKENNSLLIPAALAAETTCESKWKSETNLTKIINYQLDCLYDKIEANPSEEKNENLLNKSFRGMQNLSLGLTTDGLGFDRQIGLAIAGYTGPLNPVMTTLIKPKVAPGPFLFIVLFNNAMITINNHCKAYPDSCYAHKNFAIADPLNVREILFIEYGMPQSIEYRFQTPDEFRQYFFNEDQYDIEPIVVPEPIPETTPLPEPVTVPRKVPSPAPVSPEPIVDIPVKPSPSPAPVVIPTPEPVIKDCWELKEDSFKACRAGCSDSQLCYQAYSGCSAGSCNIDCVNACQSTLSKCLDVSSKCFSDCNEAYYAYKCP